MTRECAYCGEEFEANDRRNVYCSGRCRRDRYAHSERARGRCSECGVLLGSRCGRGSGSRAFSGRCGACKRVIIQRDERAHQIEKWWAEGLTVYEIADRLGWTKDKLGIEMAQLRAKGYDLPHRRTPEQVERIAAGWARVRDGSAA